MWGAPHYACQLGANIEAVSSQVQVGKSLAKAGQHSRLLNDLDAGSSHVDAIRLRLENSAVAVDKAAAVISALDERRLSASVEKGQHEASSDIIKPNRKTLTACIENCRIRDAPCWGAADRAAADAGRSQRSCCDSDAAETGAALPDNVIIS